MRERDRHMFTYLTLCVYACLYIYIYREREKDRHTFTYLTLCVCLYEREKEGVMYTDQSLLAASASFIVHMWKTAPIYHILTKVFIATCKVS